MFKNDSSETVRATKSGRTRALIRETALRSFRERGYDDTTMRLIAQEAGVSVGNASYYFPSKSHLVQELYLDVQHELRAAVDASLPKTDELVERLRIAYRSGLDVLAPFHGSAPGFLAAAVSPASPINPLSSDSEPARDITIGIFRDVVGGARHGLPADIARSLPEALFLGFLLLALFWVYDSSPGQERTQRLLDRGLKLLALALPLARLPLLRAPLREALSLIAEVRA